MKCTQLTCPIPRWLVVAKWHVVVAWLVTHDSADQGLQTSFTTLKALTMELLFNRALNKISKNIWSAIEDRCSTFGHRPLLWRFKRRNKALGSLKRVPTKLTFPLGTYLFHCLQRLLGGGPSLP